MSSQIGALEHLFELFTVFLRDLLETLTHTWPNTASHIQIAIS